ncbi:MAG: hypothetical protein NC293_01570 [Roseburia sp.]|nr:hypothetical protein [Roseburia sp.]
MKKNRRTVFCIVLCAAMLTGCGGEYVSLTEGDAVSGSAVSGSTVSGDAVSEGAVNDKVAEPDAVSGSAVKNEKEARRDMSSHRFCTDTNMYFTENDSIIQARLDGTHQTYIIKEDDVKGVAIRYVGKDVLIYAVYSKDIEKEYAALYQVPVRKNVDGYDKVCISKKKEIPSYLPYFEYADSDYLFYSDDGMYLVKYDYHKKKIISETELDQDFCYEVFRIKDQYVVVANSGGVFAQPVDGKYWTKVSKLMPLSEYEETNGLLSHVYSMDDFVVQDDQAVFYPQYVTECESYHDARHNEEYTYPRSDYSYHIIRCDGEKETDFVTWEQLRKAVFEAEEIEELDMCRPDHMFWQEGRLFIQVQVHWEKDGIYHREYVILSQSTEKEDSDLHYEKDMTECMRSHVKDRVGKWSDVSEKPEEIVKEHVVINSAKCIAMVNQKAYLSLYDYKNDKGRLGCFDVNTGKFQWVEKEDALSYELRYAYDWPDIEGIYEEGLDYDLSNWDGIYEKGEFVEN